MGGKVAFPKGAEPDFSTLNDPQTLSILYDLIQFRDKVKDAADQFNPSMMCGYLYRICKKFSSWYDVDSNNISKLQNPNEKAAKLLFADAMAQTVKKGLWLIGVDVLE